MEPEQDLDEASWPIRAFYRGLSPSTIAKRKRAFKKGATLPDDDPDSYKPAPGDARAETEPSEYTLAYHKRYRDLKEASVEPALRKKADESGFPYGVLRKVFNRGVAAWKAGHKPGTTPIQWGMARVNSFIVGGRTREVGDPDLWAQVKDKIKKKNMKNESKSYEGGMARNELKTIVRAAKDMHDVIESADDLPEWVQAKITKAAEFLTDARDFMVSKAQGE